MISKILAPLSAWLIIASIGLMGVACITGSGETGYNMALCGVALMVLSLFVAESEGK